MGSADKTKLLLAEELKKQSRTTQFSKITVGGLCAACGLDRRTFYYHFRDIYDLAAWIYDRAVDGRACGPDGMLTLGGVEDILRRLRADACFYRRALAEDSQNALGRHILSHNISFYEGARKRYLGTDSLSEADSFAIGYHCFATLGMVRRWLFREEATTTELTARLILSYMPPPLRQLYSVDPKELLFRDDAT